MRYASGNSGKFKYKIKYGQFFTIMFEEKTYRDAHKQVSFDTADWKTVIFFEKQNFELNRLDIFQYDWYSLCTEENIFSTE